MRELNRLGVTSALDAGGGGQSYPEEYAVIQELARRGQMTVRIGCNLFAQKPGEELASFQHWTHATYDESISRFLAVFERGNREVPLRGLHWFVDHAETISDRNIERIRALEGGIAIQHRMAFQGEYFVHRYGKQAAERTPPIRRMLELGVPVGAGTDATRVASYNPWVCLQWLVTGRTLGGTLLYPEPNRLEREEALRLWTRGSAWFSSEETKKGALVPGRALRGRRADPARRKPRLRLLPRLTATAWA
jgi:predicted amidohydrolase YtcJ